VYRKGNTVKKKWFLGWKGASGFSASSTTEQVTHVIHGTSLAAIITVFFFSISVFGSSKFGIDEFVILVYDYFQVHQVVLETTRVLALRGVHVVMAVRNVKNGLNIKETLLTEIPNAKIDVF
jgi:WW domain-containing oxidoreductase